MAKRLPRAKPGDVVAIAADLWNRVADAVERGGKFAVAAPLEFTDTPGGPQLRIKPNPQRVRAKITSTASGAGRYNAKSIAGQASAVDPSSSFAPPDAGETVAGAEDVLVENAQEDTAVETGSGKHRLKLNTYVEGPIVGFTNGSPPKPVIRVSGGIGETASPKGLSVSTLAADATTWSRATDGLPLTVTLQTRTFWDGTGKVLYQYVRTFTYDARGLLVSVSAETRSTIDAAGSC